MMITKIPLHQDRKTYIERPWKSLLKPAHLDSKAHEEFKGEKPTILVTQTACETYECE